MIKKQRYHWPMAMLALILIISGCTAGETPLALGANKEEPLWASGTIRATEIRLASEQGGRIETLSIEEGMQVAEGDALAVIDATPWLLQLYPAEAAVATAKADLAELKAGARPEEIEAARAALALAEAQRDGAKAAWNHALAQVRNPQELDTQIIQARTTAALAAQGVEKAQSDLQIAEFTYDRKEMTQKQFEGWELRSAQQALASAQADQKAAQAALDHLLAIRERPLGYIALAHAAEGEYRVAEEGVAVAQAQLDDLLDGATPEEIAVADAAVRQAEAEAAIIRVQVEKCTLTSPIDGVVLERAFQIGEIVAPAAT
ncbi:MAG: biotin/lipoyl-binding protein, partial [Anaerolineae bacterium]|nr:biotin/lipoyl-binding protein [Anaerolineae bacterium]